MTLKMECSIFLCYGLCQCIVASAFLIQSGRFYNRISLQGQISMNMQQQSKVKKTTGPKLEVYLKQEPWQVGVFGVPGAGTSTLIQLLQNLSPFNEFGDDDSELADVRLIECPEGSSLISAPPGILMGLRKSGLHIQVINLFNGQDDVSEQIKEIQKAMAYLELSVIKDRRKKKNTKTFWLTMGKARGRRELWALDKIEKALEPIIENGGFVNYNDIIPDDQQKAIQPIGLLGNTEHLYVLNIGDTVAIEDIRPIIEQVKDLTNSTAEQIFSIPLKSELELHQLPFEQQGELRREYGLDLEELQRLCSFVAERRPVRDVRRYVPFFLRTVLDSPPEKQKKKTKSRSEKYYSNEDAKVSKKFV